MTLQGRMFYWGSRQEEAFQILKTALLSAPVLELPISGGELVLDTDANNHSMGCDIHQWQNGELKVTSFANLELHYCTTRRELVAVMFGLWHYRHYLLGFPFVLQTDHATLTHLLQTTNPVAQSARHLDTLADYAFSIQYHWVVAPER